jgi:hypothetical protein
MRLWASPAINNNRLIQPIIIDCSSSCQLVRQELAGQVLIIGCEWDPTHFSPLQKCLHVALFTSFQAFHLTKSWLTCSLVSY